VQRTTQSQTVVGADGAPRHPAIASPIVLAAGIVNLNHPATYVHWGFFQMSVSNLVVIVLMIVVFAAAIALPFRRRGER